MLQRIKVWLHTEAEKMASMTLKQKLEYIWMYFRWHILVVIAVVIAAGSLIRNYSYQSRDLLISGYFLNADTSPAGYAHLNEDYITFRDAEATGRVELTQCRTMDFSGNNYGSESLIMVDAMVSAASLDYMVVDADALHFLDGQGIIMDLTQLLPQSVLDGLNTVQSDSGVIAIDLSGTDFESEYGLYPSPSYLMVVVNTPHPEKVIAFIDYLLNLS